MLHGGAIMWSASPGSLRAVVLFALLAAARRGCNALNEEQGSNASVAAIAGALANAIITATIKADAPAIAAARPVVHCHTLAPPQDVIGPAFEKISQQKVQHTHGGAQIESTQYEIKVVAHVLSSGLISRAAQQVVLQHMHGPQITILSMHMTCTRRRHLASPRQHPRCMDCSPGGATECGI